MDQSQLLVQPMNQWSVILSREQPNRISGVLPHFLLRRQGAVDYPVGNLLGRWT